MQFFCTTLYEHHIWFLNLILIIACACESIGSLNQVCNTGDGQCECKANYGGRQCDECQNGFYYYPDCYSKSEKYFIKGSLLYRALINFVFVDIWDFFPRSPVVYKFLNLGCKNYNKKWSINQPGNFSAFSSADLLLRFCWVS